MVATPTTGTGQHQPQPTELLGRAGRQWHQVRHPHTPFCGGYATGHLKLEQVACLEKGGAGHCCGFLHSTVRPQGCLPARCDSPVLCRRQPLAPRRHRSDAGGHGRPEGPEHSAGLAGRRGALAGRRRAGFRGRRGVWPAAAGRRAAAAGAPALALPGGAQLSHAAPGRRALLHAGQAPSLPALPRTDVSWAAVSRPRRPGVNPSAPVLWVGYHVTSRLGELLVLCWQTCVPCCCCWVSRGD